jgi:hypothetical protein
MLRHPASKAIIAFAIFAATPLGTAHADTIKSACDAWRIKFETIYGKLGDVRREFTDPKSQYKAHPEKFRDLLKPLAVVQGNAPKDEGSEKACTTFFTNDPKISDILTNPYLSVARVVQFKDDPSNKQNPRFYAFGLKIQ